MSDLIFLGYRIPKIDFSIGDNFGSGPVQLDVNIKKCGGQTALSR